jgi:hypothetical protein
MRPMGLFGMRAQQPRLTMRRILREARLRQFRRSLAFFKTRLEEFRNRLDVLDRRVASEIGEQSGEGYEPAGETGYDAEESGSASQTSTSTSGSATEEVEDKPGKEVTTRALYAVFEDLENEKDEFTEDGYPFTRTVNERLHDKGYERTTQKQVHDAYDSWTHSQIKDKTERRQKGEEEDEDDRPEPPQTELFKFFERIEGRKSEFTEDGYPLVNKVNDALEDRGYAPASQEEIRSAFKKWAAEEEKEDDGGGKTPSQKVLFDIFQDIERSKKNFTSDGFPLVEVVKERLQKKNYATVEREEIHEAWKKYEKKLGDES